jgi:hypothetical protein
LTRETDAMGITLFGVFTVFNKCSLLKLAHERGTREALVNSVNGPIGSTKCGVFPDYNFQEGLCSMDLFIYFVSQSVGELVGDRLVG